MFGSPKSAVTTSVRLGVNWNALGNTGDFLIGLSNGPDVGDLIGLADDLAGDPSTSGGIPGTGDVNVEAFIDALHQEGIISLLAEPNLTAINGETGEFLAGSEIPILVPGGGGGRHDDDRIQAGWRLARIHSDLAAGEQDQPAASVPRSARQARQAA